MGDMEDLLGSLEEAVARAIRSSLTRLPWRKFSVALVARQLAKEIVASARRDKEGALYAPDQYTLSINPRGTGELDTSPPDVQERLAQDLRRALEGVDFRLVRQPHVTLATDPTLPAGEVRVIAWHSSDPTELRREIEAPEEAEVDRPVPGAFLIIEGRRHFPLTKSEVNIGRLPENDLVLGDRHVSRRHAQLRVEGGQYRIIDLQSTAGTRVNGKLVKESILKPGDVIKLATIELIYGEDRAGPPDVTPPYKPSPRPPEDRHQVTPLDLKTLQRGDTSRFERRSNPPG